MPGSHRLDVGVAVAAGAFSNPKGGERTIYDKDTALVRFFTALIRSLQPLGLTATPSDHIDRNTYTLFDLEPGVPTDAYELETAVADGFLVPPRVQQVDLKFPREGIDYDSLSEDEQEQWESLDWGDDVDENGLPDKVNAAAINSWLLSWVAMLGDRWLAHWPSCLPAEITGTGPHSRWRCLVRLSFCRCSRGGRRSWVLCFRSCICTDWQRETSSWRCGDC